MVQTNLAKKMLIYYILTLFCIDVCFLATQKTWTAFYETAVWILPPFTEPMIIHNRDAICKKTFRFGRFLAFLTGRNCNFMNENKQADMNKMRI